MIVPTAREEDEMVIKRIGVVSCGKLVGAMYFIIGFPMGLMIAIPSFLREEPGPMGIPAAVFGAGLIVAFPFLYGILGFIFSVIFAFIFNVLAGFVGGLEIEVE